MLKENNLPPVHPGEILREDVLPELGLSVTKAAEVLGISRQMLHGILNGKRSLSAEMCLKIARLAGGTPELWMRMQAMHDMKKASGNKKIMERVRRVPSLRDETHTTA